MLTLHREKFDSKLQAVINGSNFPHYHESEDESGDSSSSEDSIASQDESYFFIDLFSEDEVRELIAIFKNDYKPPSKNLWIEKSSMIQP